MTTLAQALQPALMALDRVLTDSRIGAGQPPPDPAGHQEHALDDACRALRQATEQAVVAVGALSEAGQRGTDLAVPAEALYARLHALIGQVQACATAAAVSPSRPAQGLADTARDVLVTLAHGTAWAITHSINGRGVDEFNATLTLPDNAADLAAWQALRLAYARHEVQQALVLARDEEALKRQRVRDRAALDESRRELAKSIFWSQVVAAGLAVWLLG